MNYRPVLVTLALTLTLLLAGCASTADRMHGTSTTTIQNETRAMAEAGDLAAMERMIRGQAQVEFPPFGQHRYVPFQLTGTSPSNQRKYHWTTPIATYVEWIRRAADAGSDDMQRVLVLCYQFGCQGCFTPRERRRQAQCSASDGIARDLAAARHLARDFRAGSAKPTQWDRFIAALAEMQQLEPRVAGNDVAATARMAELYERAPHLAAPLEGGNVYMPYSSTSRLVLQNDHKPLLQAAARLGHQASLERIDPEARKTGQARRLEQRIQTALRQQAQQQRQLLRALKAH